MLLMLVGCEAVVSDRGEIEPLREINEGVVCE